MCRWPGSASGSARDHSSRRPSSPTHGHASRFRADLDPETASKVTEALLELNRRGRALIIATHDPALIAAMDNRIAVAA